MADYRQVMDDAVAVLLAESGIPQDVWDAWTESTEASYQWLEERNAALAASVMARMPRFVRLIEERP